MSNQDILKLISEYRRTKWDPFSQEGGGMMGSSPVRTDQATGHRALEAAVSSSVPSLTCDAALLSAPLTQFLYDKGQHGRRQRQTDSELLQRLPVQSVRAVPQNGRWRWRTVDAVGHLFLWTKSKINPGE